MPVNIISYFFKIICLKWLWRLLFIFIGLSFRKIYEKKEFRVWLSYEVYNFYLVKQKNIYKIEKNKIIY